MNSHDVDTLKKVSSTIYDAMQLLCDRRTVDVSDVEDYREMIETMHSLLEFIELKIRKYNLTTCIAAGAINSKTPNWSYAPDWAEYAAMNKDGTWQYFNSEPVRCTGCWDNSFGYMRKQYVSVWKTVDSPIKWKKSVEKRPADM